MILKLIRHFLVTDTWFPFCNHNTLYGLRCDWHFSPNFSMNFIENEFSVLPPSTIVKQHMSTIFILVQNIYFHCVSPCSSPWFNWTNIFLVMRFQPSSSFSSSSLLLIVEFSLIASLSSCLGLVLNLHIIWEFVGLMCDFSTLVADYIQSIYPSFFDGSPSTICTLALNFPTLSSIV